MNAILYALDAGGPWRLLPPQLGAPDAVKATFDEWADNGVFRTAYEQLYPRDTLSRGRTLIIDGSYAKVHPAAIGDNPAAEKIGRTSGGDNTNVVVAVNEDRDLVDWTLLAGNVDESEAMPILLNDLQPAQVVADAAHDKKHVRKLLAARDIDGLIATNPRRQGRRARHPAKWLQNRVDNFFARLKNHRRVATRYEPSADAYDAVIAVAALWIALRRDHP